MAYKVAEDEFLEDGNNRIILATAGDFNVGVSDDQSLIQLISQKRNGGTFLSVLGFGTGNLQSSKMEKIADNGNGNYYYIDDILEAKKVLVNEIGGTLITIAKDVKLQLEINPKYVKNYRLLGYENRMLQTRDFANDKIDAGELGSGHTVVALYEITPQKDSTFEGATNLRYQKNLVNVSKDKEDEIAIVKFRYKKPKSNKSRLIEKVILNKGTFPLSDNFEFASAVAEFGMLIRNSAHKGNASFKNVIKHAKRSKGTDENGYRAEFIKLVEKAERLMQEYHASDQYLKD